MLSELDEIKQVFNNYKIPLSMEWLESCVEWCKNDNLPPNYTLKELQNMVYQQWLILDLRDVEIASLPRNLSKEKKYLLTGVYYVQLMQVVDISKPKLWQLQKIRNNAARNTEVERDFGKRVLQLSITDGVQDVQAMEFKPIAALNLNLTPGTKLKLVGPIMIRNGRLMLESQHVKNLGGSVDELLINFAAENVLARALGLSENPNPQTIDENILDVTEQNTTQQADATNIPQNQSRVAQNNATTTRNINHNMPIHTNIRPPPTEVPPEYQVDNELLRELEQDFEENPQQCTSRNTNNVNRSCESPDLFDEIDEELLNDHLDQIVMAENIIDKKIETPSNANLNCDNSVMEFDDELLNEHLDQLNKDKKVEATTNKNEVIVLDDSFDQIDIDSHLDNIDKEMANIPCSTQNLKNIKQHIKSPELKNSKKLAQSKLNFVSKQPLPLLDKDKVNDLEKFFVQPKNAIANVATVLPWPSNPKPSNQEPKEPSPKGCKINVMSIEKLKKLIPNVSKGKFKIKAKFKVVAEKFRNTADSFYLAIIVEDATGELTVELQTDLVCSFTSLGPGKMAELRLKALEGDEECKHRIHQALHRLHDKCLSINNILELQITRGEKFPVLLNVLKV